MISGFDVLYYCVCWRMLLSRPAPSWFIFRESIVNFFFRTAVYFLTPTHFDVFHSDGALVKALYLIMFIFIAHHFRLCWKVVCMNVHSFNYKRFDDQARYFISLSLDHVFIVLNTDFESITKISLVSFYLHYRIFF